MKKLLLDINSNYKNTPLFAAARKVFQNQSFPFDVDKSQVSYLEASFGSIRDFEKDFDYFNPCLDAICIDLYNGVVDCVDIIVSDNYNVDHILRFKYSETLNIYKLIFNSSKIDDIEAPVGTKEINDQLLNSVLSINDIGIHGFFGLNKLNIGDDVNPILSVPFKYFSGDKEKIKKIIFNRLFTNDASIDVDNIDDFNILEARVEITNVDKPFVESILLECDDKQYCYVLKNDFLYESTLSAEELDLSNSPYFVCLLNQACERLIEDNADIENELKINQNYSSFVVALEEQYGDSFDGESLIIPSIDQEPILILDDENVKVRECQDDVGYIDMAYLDLKEPFLDIFNKIKLFISYPHKSLREWANKVEKTFESSFDIDTLNTLIDEGDSLSDVDRNNELYEQEIEKINKEIENIGLINECESATKAIKDLIIEYKENPSYESRDVIYDAYNELTKQEYKDYLSESFNSFCEQVLKEDSVKFAFEDKRRVFIHKNALKIYKTFDKKLVKAISEIVRNMKTLPAKELQHYFLHQLGINSPYDSINLKIRVKNIQPYRICFWKGENISERPECRNDIFIYTFIVDHDEDIKKMKEQVPEHYYENDFEIFITDNADEKIRLPELTTYQYQLSDNNKGPAVVYGCAGSGKTIISVDQYWQLVSSSLEGTGPDNIVYITFQKRLKNTAEQQLRAYAIEPNCFTLEEYFKYVANTEFKNKTVGEKEFLTWFKDYYFGKDVKKDKRESDIKYIKDKPDVARLIYTFYRGVFKGHVSLYTNVDFKLSKKDFIAALEAEQADGKRYLTDNEIDNIYSVCNRYYTTYCHAKGKEELYDDNDWAVIALKALNAKRGKRTKNIIIDEVQDLTALQLHVVIRSLSTYNIFFYGDPHQTVNPTIFTDSVLNSAIFAVLGKDHPLKNSEQLHDLHRTNEGLRKYLVYLQNTRREVLGNYMDNVAQVNDKFDNEIQIDDRWASYLINSPLENDVLKAAQESASMIIVPDDKTKEELIEKHPEMHSEYILTIYEAKGMEWQKVVLYNLLSSAKAYFDMMFDENTSTFGSTICRMFFNKFYVACTRCRDTFVVIENNINDVIEERLLSPLASIKDETQIGYYFEGRATCDDWLNQAHMFLVNENETSANYAISQAINLATTSEEKKRINELMRLKNRSFNSREDNILYANMCLEKKDYETALLYYRTTEQWNYYNLVRVLLDRPINKMEHLRQLIDSDLLDKYPEAYPHLIKQKIFLNMLGKTYQRLTKKGL